MKNAPSDVGSVNAKKKTKIERQEKVERKKKKGNYEWWKKNEIKVGIEKPRVTESTKTDRVSENQTDKTDGNENDKKKECKKTEGKKFFYII